MQIPLSGMKGNMERGEAYVESSKRIQKERLTIGAGAGLLPGRLQPSGSKHTRLATGSYGRSLGDFFFLLKGQVASSSGV